MSQSALTIEDAATGGSPGRPVLPAGNGALARAQALAAAFARGAAEIDETARFPHGNFRELHAAGLLCLTVPRAFGGLGFGIADLAQIVGVIAQGDAATGLVHLMHNLQMADICRATTWDPALHARVIAAAVQDGALVNALRVEPELGTPARGGLPATIATRTRSGWRLSGRKIYSTGSPGLRFGLVWARTDEATPRVGMMLVEMDRPGIAIEPTWNHLGMRGTGSHDVIFTDVLLPEDHAVDLRAPEAWAARDPIKSHWSNLGIAALYDGVARAARDWLGRYLNERQPSNLGKPLASLPRMQEQMGRIEARLLTNEVLLDSVAREVDRDPAAVPATRPNLVKFTVTDNAIAAVGDALALVGNPGLSRSNPLERHYRDVLCSRVHSPQNDTILEAAGRAAFASA